MKPPADYRLRGWAKHAVIVFIFAHAVQNLASTPAILQQKKQEQQQQQHMLNTNHPTRKQLCYLHNCHTVHSL
jgi:hypothetical protein